MTKKSNLYKSTKKLLIKAYDSLNYDTILEQTKELPLHKGLNSFTVDQLTQLNSILSSLV